MTPYLDTLHDCELVRIFSESIDPIELKWHRDLEDRLIVSTSSTDWKIQLENRLPQSLNKQVNIKSGEWHRLIKGTRELSLKIVKNYEQIK